MLVIQLITSNETLNMVPYECGYMPLRCTICNAIQAIS